MHNGISAAAEEDAQKSVCCSGLRAAGGLGVWDRGDVASTDAVADGGAYPPVPLSTIESH